MIVSKLKLIPLLFVFVLSGCENTPFFDLLEAPLNFFLRRVNINEANLKIREFFVSYGFICPVDQFVCRSFETTTSNISDCTTENNQNFFIDNYVYIQTVRIDCGLQNSLETTIIDFKNQTSSFDALYVNYYYSYLESAELSKNLVTNLTSFSQEISEGFDGLYSETRAKRTLNSAEFFMNNLVKYSFDMTLVELLEYRILS